MWLPRLLRSPRRVQDRSTSLPSPGSPPSTNLNFQFSSFRDVQSLLHEDDCPKPPHSPIHRISSSIPGSPSGLLRRSTRFIRACTAALSAVRHHHRRQAAALPPPPDAHNRIVIYYTSLRVVRRTFEDCQAVRSILRGFRVKMDERDVSMDSSFLAELQGIISSLPDGARVSGGWVGENGGAAGNGTAPLSLPWVFIDGKFVGGAEEIRSLHESGDLKRMIERLPLDEPSVEGVCGTCGGYRFGLCHRCDGSHRVYTDKSGFVACDGCNRNGLIKCPACTSVVF